MSDPPAQDHAPDDLGWSALRFLRATLVASQDPERLQWLEDGLEWRDGDVVQRFRRAPPSEAGAERTWRLCVETEIGQRALAVLEAVGAPATTYNVHVHAGAATVDADRLQLHASVPLTERSQVGMLRLLASVAERQRSFSRTGHVAAVADHPTWPGSAPRGRDATGLRDLDAAVDAFGDHGVVARHDLDTSIVWVQWPWTLRTWVLADSPEPFLRSTLGADVKILVNAPVTVEGALAARVAVCLPVPHAMEVSEAERWVERRNATECSGGVATAANGAWSFEPRPRWGVLRSWVHRSVYDGEGRFACDWGAVAALAIERTREAVEAHADLYRHQPGDAHAWLRERKKITALGSIERVRSDLSKSQRVIDDQPPGAIWAHLGACARSRRSGPWLDHVSRAVGIALPRSPAEQIRFLEPLRDWLVDEVTVFSDRPWSWSLKGTDRDPVGAPAVGTPRLPVIEVRNLLAHAEAEGIAVTWHPSFDPFALGQAWRPERRSPLRSAQPPHELFRHDPLPRVPIGAYHVVIDSASTSLPWEEILLHELAHVVLGHTGWHGDATRPSVVPQRASWLPVDVREAEVCMVVALVSGRRGVTTNDHRRRLREHLALASRRGDSDRIDMWHVFVAAERLMAWCLDRPDAITTRRGSLDPFGGGGRNRGVLADLV